MHIEVCIDCKPRARHDTTSIEQKAGSSEKKKKKKVWYEVFVYIGPCRVGGRKWVCTVSTRCIALYEYLCPSRYQLSNFDIHDELSRFFLVLSSYTPTEY